MPKNEDVLQLVSVSIVLFLLFSSLLSRSCLHCAATAGGGACSHHRDDDVFD